MSRELFHKLAEQLFPFLKKIKIGGNNLGEQMLAKEKDFFLEIINRYSFQRTIVTNGLLLSNNKIKSFIEGGWIIDLSVEGGTKKTYENIRRGADFDRFISISRECCSQSKSIGETASKIRFCYTAFRDNIFELSRLVEIGAEIGIDEIEVAHLIPMNNSYRNQSLVYHKDLANNIFDEAARRAHELGVILRLPPRFSISEMINSLDSGNVKESSSWNRKICFHPWHSISINEDGNVMPCCFSNLIMGNLQNSSLEEIWNNKKYQNLRKMVNSGNPKGSCRNCPLRGNEYTSAACNDDKALLGIIGINDKTKISQLFRLKIKQILLSTSIGTKTISLFWAIKRK
jgi:radical SAM protein with 4Fe4S-binding SPASM domain